MISRTLPFVERCKALKEENSPELDSLVDASLRAMFETDGWQIVLDLMRELEAGALNAIRTEDKPEFYAGEVAAIEHLRERLRSLLQDPALVDTHDEGLTNG